MYQLSLSAGAEFSPWVYALERKLKDKFAGQALIITRNELRRVYLAVACDNCSKKTISENLKDALVDIYSSDAKLHYYKENLILPGLASDKHNILLAALVEFDAAADKVLIRNTVNVEDGLNIDGVYNFAFKDIKSRWKEIGDLTKENAAYLSDNEIFFELIKYLFSAISPKVEKALCVFDGEKYLLYEKDSNLPVKIAYSEEELICSLIFIAPICLEVRGSLDRELLLKLEDIFKPIDKLAASTLLKS